MSILLEARRVSKTFAPTHGVWRRLFGAKPDPTRLVHAVADVSLDVRAGEVFGLLGQSGSGKTTLVRTLLRLTEPTDGEVFFEGRDVGAMKAAEVRQVLRRRARLIFQHPDAVLNPAFTVAMILDEAIRAHTSLPSPARRARARALLQDVGLPPPYLGKYPHQISSGEKRRVGIARALATDPVLLVADEPVANLDVSLQGQIVELLLRLRQARGMTLVLISHDAGLLSRVCDRLGVMYAGRLVECGPREAVSPEACRHPYTRALFDARLTLAAPLPPAAVLDAPPPDAAASGCPYRPACARWQALDRPERCACEEPAMTCLGADHRAACHFAE